MDAIAQNHHSTLVLDGLVTQMVALLDERAAHPARTVVLLPYAQLLPLTRRAWTQAVPDGFAPRFETTISWTRNLGGFAPAPDDLSFDRGRDLLTAQSLLARAGLGGQGDGLAGRLVEVALQLAPLAAAQPPDRRAAWAVRARGVVVAGFDAPVLAFEAALARIALEWVAASTYATDALLQGSLVRQLDALVVLEGYQSEPLAEALKASLGSKAVSLSMLQPQVGAVVSGPPSMHPANNPGDEAERAAACVLQHIEAGRLPVALAATDRALTRRIRAMLGSRGVALRDETGWKLSTTRAAAHLMVALRACAWHASSDAVLDWLKNAPAWDVVPVTTLEKALRDAGMTSWQAALQRLAAHPHSGEWVVQVEARRSHLQAPRPVVAWLQACRELLQASGQWDLLAGDQAGEAVMAALRLTEGAEADWAELPQAARRMGLAEFTAWVSDVLEAASFKPEHLMEEQVVILPFAQMLGQSFAAAVLPGCDENNLPASPEPPGNWTTAQRLELGLPLRESLAAAQRNAWQQALTTSHCDVLWRQADASGEPLLPSPLVQLMQLASPAPMAHDPRTLRSLVPQATLHPQPVGKLLPVARLSAGAYEDLRRCPYRFFALRQLGLKEVEELDAEVDKRDFGTWLHAVLHEFHQAQAVTAVPPGPARVALIDALADAQTRRMGLADSEFLPFAASWPSLRNGYLDWLEKHERSGARFVRAESEQQMPLGWLTLVGRIDRIDQTDTGGMLVMDYKTEGLATTQGRVKTPTEDTQLAFYAALLEDDTLSAAYINIGEKETKAVEQHDVVAARDALLEGILHDMNAIADGAPMPALGEENACNYCAARGLCRKDFWA